LVEGGGGGGWGEEGGVGGYVSVSLFVTANVCECFS